MKFADPSRQSLLKDYHKRPPADQLLKHQFVNQQSIERRVRNELKGCSTNFEKPWNMKF